MRREWSNWKCEMLVYPMMRVQYLAIYICVLGRGVGGILLKCAGVAQ